VSSQTLDNVILNKMPENPEMVAMSNAASKIYDLYQKGNIYLHNKSVFAFKDFILKSEELLKDSKNLNLNLKTTTEHMDRLLYYFMNRWYLKIDTMTKGVEG
jgi:hypothetical protein